MSRKPVLTSDGKEPEELPGSTRQGRSVSVLCSGIPRRS